MGRRHVAHLEEEALAAAQVFLDLVLVETAELLKIRKTQICHIDNELVCRLIPYLHYHNYYDHELNEHQ